MFFSPSTGVRLGLFPDHKSFVQGVAFDPLNEYLATMSCDRWGIMSSAVQPVDLEIVGTISDFWTLMSNYVKFETSYIAIFVAWPKTKKRITLIWNTKIFIPEIFSWFVLITGLAESSAYKPKTAFTTSVRWCPRQSTAPPTGKSPRVSACSMTTPWSRSSDGWPSARMAIFWSCRQGVRNRATKRSTRRMSSVGQTSESKFEGEF